MNVMTFTYELGDRDGEITMLVLKWDELGRPVGYEVWPSNDSLDTPVDQWIVDDELTTIIHPIRVVVTVGKVSRVIL